MYLVARGLMFALAVLPLPGQPASFSTAKFHGRDAYVLENARMRVSTLRGGGHIGEVRFKSPDPKKSVNPLRIAHYPTINPYEYDPAVHDALYGAGSNRYNQSGYMGHYTCFPNYGPPSPAEIQADLNNHGEAIRGEWKQEKVENQADAVTLRYSAALPRTQYRIGRGITLPADETVVYVEEWVENLARFDRPFAWVQHITFGAPFVEQGRNFVDAPVARVYAERPGKTAALAWPEASLPGGKKIDLRQFATEAASGGYRAWLLDRKREKSFFTMYHPDYPVLIGYMFYTADNPWIGDWQENRKNTTKPWDGKVVARGMEVGTTPFGAPIRSLVEGGPLDSVPTYRWISAKQKLEQRYVIFLAEIPRAFRGVADVRSEPGRIVIEERETGKAIVLKSARRW